MGERSRASCARSSASEARAVGRAHAARAAAGLDGIGLLAIDSGIVAAAARLQPPALRSLDAIHLATALSLGDDLGVLIAYDARLLQAARQHGLPVAEPR
jgi:uncharacterized protein